MTSEIRNPQLWQDGRLKIDWVRHHMPLLNSLEEEFSKTLPFKGLKVALSVHLEAKTAYLCEVLAAGGAEMYVTVEPCSMCASAIAQARISKLHIGTFNKDMGACGTVLNILDYDIFNSYVEINWCYNKRWR